MKVFLKKVLRFFAKGILKKYSPEIVAITGSVGKTSTKEAIYHVLSFQYSVRQNVKNYNNELGVPLTIINAETGGKSIHKWAIVFYRAIKLLIIRDKKYPEILVLELGTDKVGDIPYLLEFVKPKIGVFTAVGRAHLHTLKNVQGVLKEKEGVVTKLPSGNEYTAVLNADDDLVMSIRDKVKARVFTYGIEKDCDVLGREILFSGLEKDFCEKNHEFDCTVWGTSFKVTYMGSTVPMFLPRCFGRQQVYSALGAVSVGLAYGMNLVDISDALRQYRAPKGRMNIIPGIKYTLLIDDTYNSSPSAAIAALKSLSDLDIPEGARKIAVLGDMLELGDESENAHREIGFKAVESDFDYLFTVGKESRVTAQAAQEAGMSAEKIYSFDNSDEAGRVLQDIMKEGDVVLIKGSQGVRMERVVKEVMANPINAEKLLVRQTEEWIER